MTFSGDLRRYCYVLTTIIILEGLTLLVRGILIAKQWNSWSEILGNGFDLSSTTTIIIGALLLILSLFGFMGLCINGYGMLIIYCTVLFFMSFIMLIYGLYLWIDVGGAQSTMRVKLQTTLESLPPYLMFNLEDDLKCCGVDSFSDYFYEKNYSREFWGEINFLGNETVYQNGTERVEESHENENIVKILNLNPSNERQENKTTKGFFEKWRPTTTTEKIFAYMFFKIDPRSKTTKPDVLTTFLTESSIENLTEIPENQKNFTHSEILDAATWPVVYGRDDPRSLDTVYSWEDRIRNKVGRWNISTPWGKTNDDYIILPQSCCKTTILENFCYGHPSDTWQFGCKNKLDNYFSSINIELSLLLIGFSITPCITGFAVLVFKKVIKQKYWFWAK